MARFGRRSGTPTCCGPTEAAELKAEVLRMEQENEGLECSEEDDVEDPQ